MALQVSVSTVLAAMARGKNREKNCSRSLQIFGDLCLTVGLIKLLLSQNIRFRVKVAIINQLFYADVLSQMA